MTPTPTVQRLLTGITLLAFLVSAAIAQPPPPPPPTAATIATAATASTPPPAFTIADVHVSPHRSNAYMNGGQLRGGRYVVHQATMVDLVSMAYGVEDAKVLGGPSWLDNDHFEIFAAAPTTTSKDDVTLMLRNLLADRFNLVVHNDAKPMPAFVMTVSKAAPRMKQSDGSGTSGCKAEPLPTNTAPNTPSDVTCHGESMTAFANFLHPLVYVALRQPIVDLTGLKGLWDFDIKLNMSPRTNVDGIALFDSVESQLGLKIKPGTTPLPVLLVDSVNETPTPNPPGVAAVLPPPPPAEFDVAVIKPSRPDGRGMLRVAGGQIDIAGIPLQTIISMTWQIDPQRIADAPKWLNQDKFDILAKVTPPESSPGAATPPPLDFDALQPMLKKLIEDRFNMKSHMEDRPIDAYVLLAVNPKLKKADPLYRSGCKEGPGPDGNDPRIANPILGRLISCQNTTMAQLADVLQWRSNGYLKSPVFDATGLTGAYDFVLSFSGYSQVGGINGYTPPPPPPGSPDAAHAADPTGGLLMFDAIKQQLGLKIEKQKHTVSMLVIDHIDEKPTDN